MEEWCSFVAWCSGDELLVVFLPVASVRTKKIWYRRVALREANKENVLVKCYSFVAWCNVVFFSLSFSIYVEACTREISCCKCVVVRACCSNSVLW